MSDWESSVDPFIEETKDGFRVGAKYKSDGSYGPVADIYLELCGKNDKLPSWVIINTDDYEGCAMLHVETIPNLIAALTAMQEKFEKLQASIKPSQQEAS